MQWVIQSTISTGSHEYTGNNPFLYTDRALFMLSLCRLFAYEELVARRLLISVCLAISSRLSRGILDIAVDCTLCFLTYYVYIYTHIVVYIGTYKNIEMHGHYKKYNYRTEKAKQAFARRLYQNIHGSCDLTTTYYLKKDSNSDMCTRVRKRSPSEASRDTYVTDCKASIIDGILMEQDLPDEDPTPHASGILYIYNDSMYLRIDPDDSMLDIPGGKREFFNERTLDIAIREFMEECISQYVWSDRYRIDSNMKYIWKDIEKSFMTGKCMKTWIDSAKYMLYVITLDYMPAYTEDTVKSSSCSWVPISDVQLKSETLHHVLSIYMTKIHGDLINHNNS